MKASTVTKFVHEEVEVVDGVSVFFDGNSKITVGNGSFDAPTANSFSTVAIRDCPYSTALCRSSCYVAGLKKYSPDTYSRYEHNSVAIRQLILPNQVDKTVAVFSEFAKKNAAAGFRWHVSGDIFSADYAEFMSRVCRVTPEVPFWVYTRSFPYVDPLAGIPNLVVNLSGDAENWEQAYATHKKFGFRICYMSTSGEVPAGLASDSVIFPDYNLRGRDLPNPKDAPWWGTLEAEQKRMVCPPDFFGQSEKVRCGPCKKCLKPALTQLGSK